jgi:hypothetical protein
MSPSSHIFHLRFFSRLPAVFLSLVTLMVVGYLLRLFAPLPPTARTDVVAPDPDFFFWRRIAVMSLLVSVPRLR